MDRMNNNPKDNRASVEPDQTAESEKSRKTRAPKFPHDRNTPQMRSHSTSNDSEVSSFKESGGKSSLKVDKQKEELKYEKSRNSDYSATRTEELEGQKSVKKSGNKELGKILASINSDLSDFDFSDPRPSASNISRFLEIFHQLCDLAKSVDDEGLQYIFKLAQQQKILQRMVGGLSNHASEIGDQSLLRRLEACQRKEVQESGLLWEALKILGRPGAAESDIRHASSIVELMQKGVGHHAEEKISTGGDSLDLHKSF